MSLNIMTLVENILGVSEWKPERLSAKKVQMYVVGHTGRQWRRTRVRQIHSGAWVVR
jgi:hypothetical protein